MKHQISWPSLLLRRCCFAAVLPLLIVATLRGSFAHRDVGAAAQNKRFCRIVIP